jgi:hypothetical protein
MFLKTLLISLITLKALVVFAYEQELHQDLQITIPLPPEAPLITTESILMKPAYLIPQLDLSESRLNLFLNYGVPEQGLRKIFEVLRAQNNKEYRFKTYRCTHMSPASVRPCDDDKRYKTLTIAYVQYHKYAAVIDYAKSSEQKRFYLLNLVDGTVERFLVTHGRGSGLGAVSWKFSNSKDSKQTSLGLYMTGETYHGGYGRTLRMYGMQNSNSAAYDRDIVMHGAYYAHEDFKKIINPATKKPFGRIGVSWGCPALAPQIAQRIISLLAGGALIYHDHADLNDVAQSGKEVRTDAPIEMPEGPRAVSIPLPPPRPANL